MRRFFKPDRKNFALYAVPPPGNRKSHPDFPEKRGRLTVSLFEVARQQQTVAVSAFHGDDAEGQVGTAEHFGGFAQSDGMQIDHGRSSRRPAEAPEEGPAGHAAAPGEGVEVDFPPIIFFEIFQNGGDGRQPVTFRTALVGAVEDDQNFDEKRHEEEVVAPPVEFFLFEDAVGQGGDFPHLFFVQGHDLFRRRFFIRAGKNLLRQFAAAEIQQRQGQSALDEEQIDQPEIFHIRKPVAGSAGDQDHIARVQIAGAVFRQVPRRAGDRNADLGEGVEVHGVQFPRGSRRAGQPQRDVDIGEILVLRDRKSVFRRTFVVMMHRPALVCGSAAPVHGIK